MREMTLTLKIPEGMNEQEVFDVLHSGVANEIGNEERRGASCPEEKAVLAVLKEADPRRREDSVEEELYDDSMDGDHTSALASAGFGTDEDYW